MHLCIKQHLFNMQKLSIDPTEKTPEILFSHEDNIFMIKGISRPENARAVFIPVLDWLAGYKDMLSGEKPVYSRENPFTLQLDLEYFNSSSAKFLYDTIKTVKSFSTEGIPAIIEWTWDPEDPESLEAGEDLAELAGIEFAFIKRQV